MAPARAHLTIFFLAFVAPSLALPEFRWVRLSLSAVQCCTRLIGCGCTVALSGVGCVVGSAASGLGPWPARVPGWGRWGAWSGPGDYLLACTHMARIFLGPTKKMASPPSTGVCFRPWTLAQTNKVRCMAPCVSARLHIRPLALQHPSTSHMCTCTIAALGCAALVFVALVGGPSVAAAPARCTAAACLAAG